MGASRGPQLALALALAAHPWVCSAQDQTTAAQTDNQTTNTTLPAGGAPHVFFSLGAWEVTLWWLIGIVIVLTILLVSLVLLLCWCRLRKDPDESRPSSRASTASEAHFDNPVFAGARPDADRSSRAYSMHRHKRVDGDIAC